MKLPCRYELKHQQCRSEASDRALLALTPKLTTILSQRASVTGRKATPPAQACTEHANVTSR